MVGFFQKNKKDIEAFCRVSAVTGARPDYVQGGGGNTSVKFLDGLMAIKASGFCLKDISPTRAYAVLDGAAVRNFYVSTDPSSLGDVEKVGSSKVKESICKIEGIETLRPSVEAGFHSLLDKFVSHTHPLYANLAGCATICEGIVQKALKGADYAYGIVPYADPGARLTFHVRDEIDRVTKETGCRPAVLLLKNHGLVVHHDDPEECLRIQEDVNRRIAAVFGLTDDRFPLIGFTSREDGLLVLDCPYLAERLQSTQYGERFFLKDALYPDQIVFLLGYLSFGVGLPDKGTAVANPQSGTILFNMPEARARVIAETMVCVTFIAETLAANGVGLAGMGEAGKTFIANWESEKYRRFVAEKR